MLLLRVRVETQVAHDLVELVDLADVVGGVPAGPLARGDVDHVEGEEELDVAAGGGLPLGERGAGDPAPGLALVLEGHEQLGELHHADVQELRQLGDVQRRVQLEERADGGQQDLLLDLLHEQLRLVARGMTAMC